jgi:hypothetical protein
MALWLTKKNKRIWIVECDTELRPIRDVYTPPEFIRHRIPGRTPYHHLIDDMGRLGEIDAIMAFESRWSPKKSRDAI